MDKKWTKVCLLVLVVLLMYSVLAFCNRDTAPDSSDETVAVQPTSSPKVYVEPLPESDAVSPDYFDDCVFVGDSVSVKLEYYCAATGALGNAQFLASGSLGSGNSLREVGDDTVLPVWNGEEMHLEDSIPLTGAKKLYIMLGINDIALYGVDASVENYTTLLASIKAKSPDIKVFVQSATPMTSQSDIATADGINNDKLKQYNHKLLEMCKQNGYHFVDVASVMFDESGKFLRDDYCSDVAEKGIHFSDAGCVAWVNYLLTHTAD